MQLVYRLLKWKREIAIVAYSGGLVLLGWETLIAWPRLSWLRGEANVIDTQIQSHEDLRGELARQSPTLANEAYLAVGGEFDCGAIHWHGSDVDLAVAQRLVAQIHGKVRWWQRRSLLAQLWE